jgi:hypothetical protein
MKRSKGGDDAVRRSLGDGRSGLVRVRSDCAEDGVTAT